MSNLREAATLALDALEGGAVLCELTAANILRAALAEPEQELSKDALFDLYFNDDDASGQHTQFEN